MLVGLVVDLIKGSLLNSCSRRLFSVRHRPLSQEEKRVTLIDLLIPALVTSPVTQVCDHCNSTLNQMTGRRFVFVFLCKLYISFACSCVPLTQVVPSLADLCLSCRPRVVVNLLPDSR